MRKLARCALVVLILMAFCHTLHAETWTTGGAKQFAAGQLDGVSVLSTGEVRLAPETEKIEGLQAEFVWDVEAAPDGALYVGTGSPGGLYELRDGALKELRKLEKQHLLSVLPLPGGGVLAGTAPEGRILRIAADGEVSILTELEDAYIWDMALGPDGQIYCATGPEGRLLECSPKGECRTLLEVEQKHLMCVAVAPDGSIYVGSAPDGFVYLVTEGGTRLIYDADEAEIHDLIVAEDGTIYACTATAAREGSRRPQPGQAQPPGAPQQPSSAPPPPQIPVEGAPKGRNSVYRIVPGRGAVRIAAFDKVFLLSLALFDGRLLVGTGPGGRLMAVEPDETQSVLDEFDVAHITAMAVGPNGDAVLGTSNPGGLMRLHAGNRSEGTLLSKPFDAGYLARWGQIWWEHTVRRGQQIRLRLRTGNSSEPDDYWSDWSEWSAERAGEKSGVPPGRFAQFAARLAANPQDGSPRLWRVAVSYRQVNRRPRIADITFDGVSLLKKEGDGNSRSPRSPNQRAQSQERSPTATIEWKATDPNDDELAFDLYYRGMDEARWKVLEEDVRGERKYQWDTSRVPAGRYALRLIARDNTDRPAAEALSEEKVTPPIVIDNRLPAIVELKAQPQPNNSYKLTGAARDNLSRITRIQVSRNSEDWEAVFPTDGIFDSPAEKFAYHTGALEPGEHVFVFAATDESHNVGSGKIVVTVRPGN